MPTNHTTRASKASRISARLMAIALEAYDLGTELAAEKMDGLAAEIRIRGAMDLLAAAVDELNFVYTRFLLAPDDQERELELTRIVAAAIPPERRFR